MCFHLAHSVNATKLSTIFNLQMWLKPKIAYFRSHQKVIWNSSCEWFNPLTNLFDFFFTPCRIVCCRWFLQFLDLASFNEINSCRRCAFNGGIVRVHMSCIISFCLNMATHVWPPWLKCSLYGRGATIPFDAINFYNEKIELIEYFRFSRRTRMFEAWTTWTRYCINVSLKTAFDQTKNNDQTVAKWRQTDLTHTPLDVTCINVDLHKLTFRISDKLPRTYHHHMHIFVHPQRIRHFTFIWAYLFCVRQNTIDWKLVHKCEQVNGTGIN